MGIGPISNYDFWKLQGPPEADEYCEDCGVHLDDNDLCPECGYEELID